MKIYAYVDHYPSLFKPYYDTQFADFLESGHDLTVFTIDGGHHSSELCDKSGLLRRIRRYNPDELRALPFFVHGTLAGAAREPAATWRLLKHFKKTDNSLKHAAKNVVRATNLPRSSPDLNLVHSHETMRLFLWLRVKYPDAPVALYYHGGRPPEMDCMSANEIREVFRSADIVFVPSQYARGEAVDRGCDAGKVEVLPVAFDMDRFRFPDDREYRPDGTLRLISVGRMSEGKGQELAVRAISAFQEERPRVDVKLRLVGDGPMRGEIEDLIEEESLWDTVELTGGLPFERVRELYLKSDVLILSSYSTECWTETQGAVIQEAMLAGNLVITTATGGVPESIPGIMKPYHVPPRNVEALTEALAGVAALNPQEMRGMGRGGRQWVEDNYRISEANAKLLEKSRNVT